MSRGRIPDQLALPMPAFGAARPFLKWAGGKGGLVREIVKRFPSKSPRRYYEPFLGGGAVFFEVKRLYPEVPCIIGDSNAELIACYQAIQKAPREVIAALRVHAAEHQKDALKHYYDTRARRPDDLPDVAARAARLVYLNRTCFNGLYRVNRSGQFNVPMGRYKAPRILDEPLLMAVSRTLEGVTLISADFAKICSGAGPGDLVYFDPPYEPVSRSSSFTAYTPTGFGKREQERLARTVAELVASDVSVVFSNSYTRFTRNLYKPLEPRVAIDTVKSLRTINSRIDRRGAVREILVWTPRGAISPAEEPVAAGAPLFRRKNRNRNRTRKSGKRGTERWRR